MKHNIYKTIFVLSFILFSKVSNSQCQASFSYTNSGATFTFTNTSNAGAGAILQNLWNFGDGGTSGQASDSHTYTNCGTYVVSLTIGTSAFCTSTFTDTIQVNIPINGSFTATVDTTNGNTNFVAQPVNINYNYSWIYGDGGTGTGAISTHTYASGGNYTACLLINDNSGLCSDTMCNSVLVYIANPSCAISFTTQALGGTVIFNPTPFSITDTYIWNYGDGSPKDTALLGNHTYTASGNYVVCVTVVTLQGCTNTFCQTVNVALTGIDEITKNNFSVFPNPAGNHLSLKSQMPTKILNASFIDYTGRKIEARFLQKDDGIEFDLSNLESGIYLLELITTEKRSSVRFVKK